VLPIFKLPGDEIAQGLVVDDTLFNGFTNSNLNNLLIRKLLFTRVKADNGVLDLVELGVTLIIWRNEVLFTQNNKIRDKQVERIHEVARWEMNLNLRKCEFSHTKETTAGSNFVTEGGTNLSTSKWQFATILFKKTGEIYEDTLGSFGTQVTYWGCTPFSLEYSFNIGFR